MRFWILKMCTMPSQSRHTNYIQIALILLISVHIGTALPAKGNARPVIEIINERDRIDDKVRLSPYGNPLAGNSKQNARLHAQNQQAMFNAEKIRQHRAQLQRWTMAPPQVDSYMRAYHESMENHQLALEQQHAPDAKSPVKTRQVTRTENTRTEPTPVNSRHVTRSETFRTESTPVKSRTVTRSENFRTEPTTKLRQVTRSVTPRTETTPAKTRQVIKTESSRLEAKRLRQGPDPAKIAKTDDALKSDSNRNHRSYGSVEYHQYLQPKRYQTVYVSPAPTYDQGVTIKPNGNVGLAHLKVTQESKLYTEAIPSTSQYIYPKHYHQMQNYQSAQDIEALNSLLNKKPTEQLSQLANLVNSGNDDTLNTPIDLYFYAKNPSQSLENYEHDYGQQNYASAYMPVKDHTPITEEVDDIEDPNKNNRLKSYGVQPVLATEAPEVETTTTKSNNYYKVEVASQSISAPYRAKQYYYKEQDKPNQYGHQQISFYLNNPEKHSGDDSERYLHHNAQHIGIQHLSEDGTEVSAYGDENLHYAANYEFGYRVRDHHSGNDFGHHEAKKGDKTRGHYHVLLPDGRMQKVKYSAGPEGFHADISYDHLQ